MLSILVVAPVDRTPYQEMGFYEEMDARLDSLDVNYFTEDSEDSLKVGYARISLTPSDTIPLAGYGARDPMVFDRILDSVFVRTVVLKSGERKVAVLAADLLIIHPEIDRRFTELIAEFGWERAQVFFSATHSHSSIGGWAEGISSTFFSGTYDPEVVEFIAKAMVQSLLKADQMELPADMAFVSTELGDLVKNRLHSGGLEDKWMRNVFLQTDSGRISISAFAAHATCFSHRSRALTGDFPSYFHDFLRQDSSNLFSLYMAGAVGSMGPEGPGRNQEKAIHIGSTMAEQLRLLTLFGIKGEAAVSLDYLRLTVPVRSPQLKVAKNLKIRPWLFTSLLGEYGVEIAVLKLNNIVIVGMPSDFSGELALPLYDYAEELGFDLIITSFNGDYMGYVTKDEWYDLEKYETRTMNWYGPDSGAYFTEIVIRILNTLNT